MREDATLKTKPDSGTQALTRGQPVMLLRSRGQKQSGRSCGLRKARRRNLREGRWSGVSLLPPHRSRHLDIQGRKNRLYLQVITFRKDPSLALKNLPITPNPTPAQIWGGWAMGAATEGCPPPHPPEVQGPSPGKEHPLGTWVLGWMGAPGGGVLPLGHCPVLDFKSNGPCKAQRPGAAGTRACSSNGPF